MQRQKDKDLTFISDRIVRDGKTTSSLVMLNCSTVSRSMTEISASSEICSIDGRYSTSLKVEGTLKIKGFRGKKHLIGEDASEVLGNLVTDGNGLSIEICFDSTSNKYCEKIGRGDRIRLRGLFAARCFLLIWRGVRTVEEFVDDLAGEFELPLLMFENG